MTSKATVIRLEAAQAALRDHFLGWQCRVRQYAVRHAGGRPTSGMRPTVTLPDGGVFGPMTVLLIKAEPEETTAQFRHLARKTHDPADRYAGALSVLAAAYYQRPREFSDAMTALFGPSSEIVRRLLAAGRCELDFEQYNQRYHIPCAVRRLGEHDPAYRATYWHNSLFNPNLPGGVQILAFRPDWARAGADPAVT